jgi:hypothetical protein
LDVIKTFKRIYPKRKASAKALIQAKIAKKEVKLEKTSKSTPAPAKKKRGASTTLRINTSAPSPIILPPPTPSVNNSNSIVEFKVFRLESEKMRNSERDLAIRCATLEGTVQQMEVCLQEKDKEISWLKSQLDKK